MKFKFEFLTQTQLGEIFGETSHQIGKWLKQIDLRNKDGKPTTKAHQGEFCKTASSGDAGYYWIWQADKTVAALQNAGHRPATNLPQHLVEPFPLKGPFTVQRIADSFAIQNADGSTSVWANSRKNADVLATTLNLAHKHGFIQRNLARNIDLENISAVNIIVTE